MHISRRRVVLADDSGTANGNRLFLCRLAPEARLTSYTQILNRALAKSTSLMGHIIKASRQHHGRRQHDTGDVGKGHAPEKHSKVLSIGLGEPIPRLHRLSPEVLGVCQTHLDRKMQSKLDRKQKADGFIDSIVPFVL